MKAVVDSDHRPLERWERMRDAEAAVVWDAHLGGWPTTVIGIESHPIDRFGPTPADGPSQWTSGTLFPKSSKKVARAINSNGGRRPLVVLANLAGFDGSPESMRQWQLEYGAEIGRAIVNFRGPIVFCVISRYHGGAFVVFSQRLNEGFETIAVEGAKASVIGGSAAAGVVFTRDVNAATRGDARVVELEERIEAAEDAGEARRLRAELASLLDTVRAEKMGELAAKFDSIHSIQRAVEVGSVLESSRRATCAPTWSTRSSAAWPRPRPRTRSSPPDRPDRRFEEVLARRVAAFAGEALDDLPGVALRVAAGVERPDLVGDREVRLADQRDALGVGGDAAGEVVEGLERVRRGGPREEDARAGDDRSLGDHRRVVGESSQVLEDERRALVVEREAVARRRGRVPAARGLAAACDQPLDVIPRARVGAVQTQAVAPREPRRHGGLAGP